MKMRIPCHPSGQGIPSLAYRCGGMVADVRLGVCETYRGMPRPCHACESHYAISVVAESLLSPCTHPPMFGIATSYRMRAVDFDPLCDVGPVELVLTAQNDADTLTTDFWIDAVRLCMTWGDPPRRQYLPLLTTINPPAASAR